MPPLSRWDEQMQRDRSHAHERRRVGVVQHATVRLCSHLLRAALSLLPFASALVRTITCELSSLARECVTRPVVVAEVGGL